MWQAFAAMNYFAHMVAFVAKRAAQSLLAVAVGTLLVRRWRGGR